MSLVKISCRDTVSNSMLTMFGLKFRSFQAVADRALSLCVNIKMKSVNKITECCFFSDLQMKYSVHLSVSFLSLCLKLYICYIYIIFLSINTVIIFPTTLAFRFPDVFLVSSSLLPASLALVVVILLLLFRLGYTVIRR